MLLFDSGGKGGFALAVPVVQAGDYDVKIYFVRAPEYGIVRLRINGEAVGEPVDTFKKTEDLTRPIWPPKAFDVGVVRLKEGINVFEFTVDSKSAEAEGYKVGIDCLVLEKSQ